MERPGTSIVFSVPDLGEPSAAVRLALRHRKVLWANGFTTSVVSSSAPGRYRWTDEDDRADGAEPRSKCVWVLTEDDREGLGRPGRKVILASRTPPQASSAWWADWAASGVEAAVSISRPVKAAIESRFGIPTTLIHPSVDRTVFAPARKERSIAYMPHQDLPAIGRILDRCRTTGYSLFPIEGQRHSGVAEILARASIFLAVGPQEGFGLASLEAMASGCLVVGFATQGGEEFMEDGSNCLLAPNGDCENMARLLELAAALTDQGRTSDLIGEAGRTARRFSPGREAVEILRFWGTFSEARTPGSPPESGPGETEKGRT